VDGLSLYRNIVDLCVSCRCGKCLDSCPIYRVVRREMVSPRGKLKVIHAYLKGEISPSESLLESIAYCTLCLACEVNCGINRLTSMHISMSRIIPSFRWELIKNGYELPQYKSIIDAVWKTDNIFGDVNHKSKQQIHSGDVEVIYWSGCVASVRRRNIDISISSILSKLKVDFKSLNNLCCGYPLYQIGYWKDLEAIIDKNMEVIRRLDSNTVVSSCPACIGFIRDFYPKIVEGKLPFRVKHISEVFQEYVESGDLKLNFEDRDIAVAYHDPCHLARYLNIYDQPRNILKNMNINLIEMEKNKLETECCGGGVRLVLPELSTTIAAQRILTIPKNTNYLLTSCPTCTINLGDGVTIAKVLYDFNTDVKVMDLAEFICQFIK